MVKITVISTAKGSYLHKLLVKGRQVTAHISIIHDTVLEKTAPVGILNDTLNLLQKLDFFASQLQ